MSIVEGKGGEAEAEAEAEDATMEVELQGLLASLKLVLRRTNTH